MPSFRRQSCFRLTVAIAAAHALIAVAAAQDRPGQYEERSRDKPAAAASSSVTPQTFATKAAVINKAEVELGQLALRNSQDPDVKKYAQRLIDDHSSAGRKLQSIAATENIKLPQSLDAKHESLKTKLQALNGAAFDREFAKEMVKGHEEAIALFESASQQTQMPESLKEFAASSLKTLEKHEEMAHSLHGKKEGA